MVGILALKGVRPDDEITLLPEWCSVTDIKALQVPELEGERHLVILSRKGFQRGIPWVKSEQSPIRKAELGKQQLVSIWLPLWPPSNVKYWWSIMTQGNATMASGVDKYQVDSTAYELWLKMRRLTKWYVAKPPVTMT